MSLSTKTDGEWETRVDRKHPRYQLWAYRLGGSREEICLGIFTTTAEKIALLDEFIQGVDNPNLWDISAEELLDEM